MLDYGGLKRHSFFSLTRCVCIAAFLIMLCPVCRQPMLIVEFDDIELDACPDCKGIWFDAQELRELFELVGAPEHGGELEVQLERLKHASARRSCPRCRGRIEPVRAPTTDGELILDQCPRGHGLWFDKGELECLFESLLGENSDALVDVRKYLGHFAAASGSGDSAE